MLCILSLIQKLRVNGQGKFYIFVKSFCTKHDIEISDIEISDIDDFHLATRFGCRLKDNHVTMENYFS